MLTASQLKNLRHDYKLTAKEVKELGGYPYSVQYYGQIENEQRPITPEAYKLMRDCLINAYFKKCQQCMNGIDELKK